MRCPTPTNTLFTPLLRVDVHPPPFRSKWGVYWWRALQPRKASDLGSVSRFSVESWSLPADLRSLPIHPFGGVNYSVDSGRQGSTKLPEGGCKLLLARNM